jgi:hypothetical protein
LEVWRRSPLPVLPAWHTVRWQRLQIRLLKTAKIK